MRHKSQTPGIRAKIQLMVGSLTGLILIGSALLFSFQSKTMIMAHLNRSSELVTRAFSVFVLDSMIKDRNGLEQIEDTVGHYVLDFMEKNPKVVAIAVWDSTEHLIAGRGLEHIQDPAYSDIPRNAMTTMIHRHDDGRWVASCFQPLKTGQIQWGLVGIHFAADQEYGEVLRLFWMTVLLSMVVIFLVLSVLGIFLSRVTRSLGILKTEIDAFDPESDRLLTSVRSDDEIGVIFHHFNDLKKRFLRSRQDYSKAQKQIFHAEKLASIGRFASGMAHEINNPLNGIQSCLYAIKQEPDNHDQTREYLSLATEGLAHIEMVVRKLLGFARKQAPSKALVDLRKELETVLGLLDYKLNKERIEVLTEIDPQLPLVTGDAHLLQELLMNLALNSFDAICERQAIEKAGFEGQLRIELIQRDQKVSITFSDNGMGIPEDKMDQIFDPFFTTKEQGKGTGLGLSVALGIAEVHLGTIVVSNLKEGGCEFKVELPLEDDREDTIS